MFYFVTKWGSDEFFARAIDQKSSDELEIEVNKSPALLFLCFCRFAMSRVWTI